MWPCDRDGGGDPRFSPTIPSSASADVGGGGELRRSRNIGARRLADRGCGRASSTRCLGAPDRPGDPVKSSDGEYGAKAASADLLPRMRFDAGSFCDKIETLSGRAARPTGCGHWQAGPDRRGGPSKSNENQWMMPVSQTAGKGPMEGRRKIILAACAPCREHSGGRRWGVRSATAQLIVQDNGGAGGARSACGL